MRTEQAIEGVPRGYSLALNQVLLRLNRLSAWPERAVTAPFLGRRPIDRPIFIVGAFRSGTTILEQILAGHPQVGAFWFFTNAAYPAPIVSYYALRALSRLGLLEGRRMGYLHNPRIGLTPFSAFECEWVWAQAGKNLWDPACTDLTTGADFMNPSFERALRSIIRRHLLVQGATRFLNKNPIHLLRLPYLHRLFPDARFVYLVRDPVATVLSHYRMVQRIAATIHPHARARRAIEEGLHLDVLTPRIKTQEYAETLALDRIHPLLGIAHQWRMMHLTAQANLAAQPLLARQTVYVDYAALAGSPVAALNRIWEFVGLADEAATGLTAAAAEVLGVAAAPAPAPEEARWLPAVREIVAPAVRQLAAAAPEMDRYA